MRLMPIPAVLAMMVLPCPSHADDLLDAYNYARSNDPTLAQSDALRRAANEGIVLARAPLLPQITAKLSASDKEQNGTSIAQRSLSVGDRTSETVRTTHTGRARTRGESAMISQSVLDFSRYADLKTAKSSSQAQNATYEAALQQLATRVATAYFQVLTNDDALAFAKANEQALAGQLERARQRFNVGLLAITDVQDAKSHHDKAVASVISAETELSDSREAMTQITGQPTKILKKLREQLPVDTPSPNDPKAWVSEAIKNNPAILASQYNVESAEHNISSARAGHLPTIESTAGYSKTTAWTHAGNGIAPPGNPASNDRGSVTIGLKLNLPIFSGGATQARIRKAIYERDAAQDVLESTRRQVVRDTLNYYRSVIAGISKIEATKAAVESSEGARNATQTGVEVGTRTIVDLLITQQNLTAALNDYSRARHQFILDKLRLKQTAGTVDAEDIKAINSLLR